VTTLTNRRVYVPARMLDAEKLTRDPTRAFEGPLNRGAAAATEVFGPAGSLTLAASAAGAAAALTASIVATLTGRRQ
jgi:hypothetical protein